MGGVTFIMGELAFLLENSSILKSCPIMPASTLNPSMTSADRVHFSDPAQGRRSRKRSGTTTSSAHQSHLGESSSRCLPRSYASRRRTPTSHPFLAFGTFASFAPERNSG